MIDKMSKKMHEVIVLSPNDALIKHKNDQQALFLQRLFFAVGLSFFLSAFRVIIRRAFIFYSKK